MDGYFQTPGDCADRKDHVWVGRKKHWKCVLCGGVTSKRPPGYPTPAGWLPDFYEIITEAERRQCPP